MAIQISGNNVVDNNRRGTFQKLNPGVYTTAQRDALSKSEGDVIYNSDEQVLQVWNGSEWRSLGGSARMTGFSGEREIWYADGYLYASWLSSGTVTVDGFGDVEVVVQAGGGGGGAGRAAGGGGAGGNVKQTVAVSPGTYTVTVGSGGNAMPPWPGWGIGATGQTAQRGGNSSIFGITANGGGAAKNFRPGGCGSGGGSDGSMNPAGSGNQGFPGGRGAFTYPGNENTFTGGGGGGIGAAGESPPAPSTTPGRGGAGKNMSQVAPGWTVPNPAVPYAPGFAGGGSGAGGTHPGAVSRPSVGYGAGGAPSGGGSSAAQYSGSGGGGGGFRASSNYGGGNGGSGFVVMRWPV